MNKLIGEDLFLPEIVDKILTLCFQLIIKALQFAKDTINSKSMSAENLLRILDEITKVEQFLNHDFLDNLIQICNKTCYLQGDKIIEQVSGSYRDLFEVLSTRFDDLNLPCISAASEKITKRLSENMEKFKLIAGVYRLTNKSMPETPSDHTKITFKPVENLVSKEFYVNLCPKLKTLLLNSIFQKSLSDLNIIIKKMLEEEKNKSTSLSKFSKEGAKNTDFDHICMQIYLDIKELENQIDEFGGSREYSELKSLYELIPGATC